MNKIIISIIVPGIRPHYWKRLYDSLILSCQQYNWEIIFIGPFDLPQELSQLTNIKYIKSYSTVPVCIQKATLSCKGDFVFHTVDDGICRSQSLDKAISLYNKIYNNKDIMNMTYTEGLNFNYSPHFQSEFWSVKNCTEFDLPNINRNWYTSVQPLMSKKYFIDIGGFDCRFEYSNHCHHDLMFRIQQDGGKIIPSPIPVCQANHMPERTGDHAPVHDAQIGPDSELFKKLWSNKRSSYINYDNYKIYDKPWIRRFTKKYNSYQEMIDNL